MQIVKCSIIFGVAAGYAAGHWDGAQGLQVFVLALFVSPSGEVPHDLETSLQVSLSHPAVDFLHFLMFFKMKNENLSLLVSYFEGTDLLFE